MWLLQQLHPDLTAYNVVRALRLRGQLDVPALSAAIDAVVARHEVLRSRIVVVDGTPRLHTDPPAPVALTVEDLAVTADPELTLCEELQREADRHVDLSTDPMLRPRLLRLGAEDWVLVLATHHVASDEASQSVLYAELGVAYAALHEGRVPALPELPLQYADWAAWQRDQLAGTALDADLDWWRGYLDGAPAALQLPGGPLHSSQPDGSAPRFVETLDPELSAELLALARRFRVTVFTVVLAGLAALLRRYGNDDVIVGFPVSARTSPEVERLIGYFSNTLVARVGVAGDPSFAELLDRSRTALVGALSHADVPFERLVGELGPVRQGGNPIFQVALSVGSGAAGVPVFRELAATVIEVAPRQAKTELALVVTPLPEGALRLEWEYDSRRFDRDSVRRTSGHLRTLLAAAVREPLVPVSSHDVVAATERNQLLDWGTGPGDPGPSSLSTLPERLASNVATHPNRVAVRDRQGALTYAELDLATHRLAARLRQLGARPGALVAVCLDRSTDLLVGLLGVLKSGAGYLPLDPDYPPDRLAFVLAQAECIALVTSEDLLGRLPSDLPRTVTMEDPGLSVEAGPLPASTSPVKPSDLAYAIYTSGSSGTPKGVLVEHSALANLLASMAREPGHDSGDVLVAVTTPAFDIAALELFLPLWVGAEVVVADHRDTLDPDRLAALLNAVGATVLQATPATWSALVTSGWPGRRGLRAWCGGEALPTSLASQLQPRCGEVWNLYGPTETTIWSLVARLQDPDDRVPIGRPIGATLAFVVDQDDRLAPIGVAGELLIGGAGVARGYLGSPELTAQRFVQLPVTGGRRVYRTGDLVRWRPDGQLEFLGRLDDQVKLRGFRVEPGEVEAALRGQPGVADAVVVLRGSQGNARLVGYVTGERPLDPATLRRSVGQRLPAYMVPTEVLQLPELPRTPNGKLDRAALPMPEAVRDQRSGRSSPTTPVEHALAQIWADVLGVSAIGRDDDFFALGGHSLLIVQLAARVRRELGLELPLAVAYEMSSLASMATALSAQLLQGPDAADLEQLLDQLEGLPQ